MPNHAMPASRSRGALSHRGPHAHRLQSWSTTRDVVRMMLPIWNPAIAMPMPRCPSRPSWACALSGYSPTSAGTGRRYTQQTSRLAGRGWTSRCGSSRQVAGRGRYLTLTNDISPLRTISRPHKSVLPGLSLDRSRTATPAMACSPILALPLLHVRL